MKRLQEQIAEIRHVIRVSQIVGNHGDIVFSTEFDNVRGVGKDNGFEGIELLKEFVHQNVVFHIVIQMALRMNRIRWNYCVGFHRGKQHEEFHGLCIVIFSECVILWRRGKARWRSGVFVFWGFEVRITSHGVANRLFVASIVEALGITKKKLPVTRFCGFIHTSNVIVYVSTANSRWFGLFVTTITTVQEHTTTTTTRTRTRTLSHR